MTGTINAKDAVKLIEGQRPDFKIASLFLHDSVWHAVYDDGPDSVRLIVVKVEDGKVIGVDPYSKEATDSGLIFDMNNRAYEPDGTALPPFSAVEEGRYVVMRKLAN